VTGGTAIISGDLFRWHTVTASFAGPDTSEQAALNPFLDLRLDVTLTNDPSGDSWVVPGFYAADGDAADTGASTGGVWQSRFTPPEEGLWHVAASFRCGTGVAVADGPTPGDPAAFDGAIGSFTIGPSPATGRDFRSMGHLEYTGERYLRFSGTDEPFLKGGADSPENLLGYIDFDDTVDHGGSANDLIDGLHRSSRERSPPSPRAESSTAVSHRSTPVSTGSHSSGVSASSIRSSPTISSPAALAPGASQSQPPCNCMA